MSGESDPDCVVDANVVLAVCKEHLGFEVPTSETPSRVFESAEFGSFRIVLDEGGKIYNEWEQTCPIEWLESWFMTLATTHNVVEVKATAQQQICKAARTEYGLPRSENIWLIKTSATVGKRGKETYLLAEDVDLFEPSSKTNSRRRKKILSGESKGDLQKLLAKNYVSVVSIAMLAARIESKI
ncbi:hypothetical protein HQO24_04295 [Rhodococcus fascians]|nr:hypothetical protein [Rhodococcus fascians]MBY4398555.1 hypothetical protein [Rhodococcus fascians]MBY4408111.1 hypothetical protein [Rhodococcus fascians]MBY4420287.1 hypothetical protein [Rhodococcus fascians]MBY4463052.1 hypothetical protein [Rhodococcus fascians]